MMGVHRDVNLKVEQNDRMERGLERGQYSPTCLLFIQSIEQRE